jgi:hypothetical protein
MKYETEKEVKIMAAQIVETDKGFAVIYGDDERGGPFATHEEAEQFVEKHKGSL